MASVNLLVGNHVVKSTAVTYDDLIELYKQFIKKNGYVPIMRECTVANNLPQGRIINRVLKERGITYKDFVGMFGKKSHARASSHDYDLFVEQFKKHSDSAGRPLTSTELINEPYNLPSSKWFIKFCPDESVKTYVDFVKWCGYEPCKKVWTKNEVATVLREFENKNGRNIVQEDIITSNTGFSMIVVNRLFGSMDGARSECGLRQLAPRYCEPDEYYIDCLTDVIMDYKNRTGSPYISWAIIESGEYGKRTYNHKCYMEHFKRAGVDLFMHVKSLGCLMNCTSYSNTYIFDTGELVRSSFEYDFTTYLNLCGFKYKEDYQRDVRYRTFSGERGKIDCDYIICVGGNSVYIEIAGVLDSSYNNTWDTIDYKDPKHIEYRNTLAKKRDILESIGVEYYFVFKEDMCNFSYMKLIESLASRRLVA